MNPIPDDWSLLTLLDHLRRPATYGVVKAGTFVSSGVPMLRGGDIKAGHISTDLPLITHEKDAEYARTRLEAEDVVVALVGYPGESAIVPPRLAGANISRAVGLLRLSGGLRPDYLVHFLNSSMGRSEFLRPGAGSAQMVVNLKDLNKLEIPCPPTALEQEAIAEALSDADALIEGLERLIAKKRLIKQGAMQDLLTAKRRLPGFSGDWEALNLSSSSHLKARIGWQGLTTQEYRKFGEHTLVTGTDIASGRVNWRGCVFVDKWRFDQDRNIQLRDGDILLTKDGTIGKVARVADMPGPAALNSGVFVIRPKSGEYHPGFAFHILSSSVFGDFLAKLTAGSTIIHLYQKDLVTFEFPAPSFAEQEAISTALDDMDAEIQALDTRLEKARQVKEGMMENLLTGRIRLV